MKELDQKVAVITGGTSGIGLSIAEALAKEGVRLVLAGMNGDKAQQVAHDLAQQGIDVIAMQCDVSQRDSVRALADAAYERFGRVDILINNAGVGQVGLLHEISDADWDWVVDVNLKGIFIVSSVFIKRFLEQEGEKLILNTGSEQCFGIPGVALGSMYPYVASKHGVLGLSEMMRRDYAQHNIHVSVLCPGPVATDIWNAGRSRQSTYGDAYQGNPVIGEALNQLGMAPEKVAQMTLEGIKNGDDYIITHRNIRELVDKRYTEVSAALDITDSGTN